MKFTLTYVALVLFTSCGSSNDSATNGRAEAETSNTPNIATSYYVDSEADLVACDGTRKGYLAYVKKTAEFKACLDAGWTTVDIKGKDGAKGQSGTATMVSGNQWYDAITTKMWVMTTINTSITGFNDSMSTCSGSYRIPTHLEVQAALGHGMSSQAALLSSPPLYIMVSGMNTNGNKGIRVVDAVFMVPGTGTAAQFCISI